jgi:uncharacterized membrane protein
MKGKHCDALREFAADPYAEPSLLLHLGESWGACAGSSADTDFCSAAAAEGPSKCHAPRYGVSNVREWIELSSEAVQDLAVVIIVASVVFGSVRFLVQLSKRGTDPYRAYKRLLGRALLLSLEFLIAADVIRTILLDETAKSVAILGGLVLVRTFLSWSVVVEIEGHWPWQLAAFAVRSERAGGKRV